MQLKKYRASILIALTFAVSVSAFWFFPTPAFMMFISLLLHLLLNPAVNFLQRKIPRAVAAGLVLTAFIAVFLFALGIISNTFIPAFTGFVTDFPNITAKLHGLAIVQNSDFLTGEIDNIWNVLVKNGADALTSSLGMVLTAFNKLIDAVIVAFVTFYLILDGKKIENYVANLFPDQDYKRVYNLIERILAALRSYITSQLTICCLTGSIVFSYFTLRDLPYASVFAVVSGIAEFIPVLGPTVASCLGTVLTATQDTWVAVQTAGFYLILTQVNHNVIYPYLIGKSLNLHPLAIILSIVWGGEFLGAPGMFLAVPIMVICKLVIEDIYRDRQDHEKTIADSRWLNMNNTHK